MVKFFHEERIEADTKTEAIKKARKMKFIKKCDRRGVCSFQGITISKVVPSNREGVFFAKFRRRKKG